MINKRIGINPPPKSPKPSFRKATKDETLIELVKWLNGEKYLIDEYSTTMTEEFEKEHQWELSRNIMINKTINKILELSFN